MRAGTGSIGAPELLAMWSVDGNEECQSIGGDKILGAGRTGTRALIDVLEKRYRRMRIKESQYCRDNGERADELEHSSPFDLVMVYDQLSRQSLGKYRQLRNAKRI